MSASTADLMDQGSAELVSCEIQFRQYGGNRRFEGTIRTVRCLEDNVLLRHALEGPGQGSVLVVDGGGSFRTALLGDHVGMLAVANGWAGIVINGCVRDVTELGQLPIGIQGPRVESTSECQDGHGGGGRSRDLWRCDVYPWPVDL